MLEPVPTCMFSFHMNFYAYRAVVHYAWKLAKIKGVVNLTDTGCTRVQVLHGDWAQQIKPRAP